MHFTTEYWVESESRVEFIPASVPNKNLLATAVRVYAIQNCQLLLTKVGRGWDLPGGHIEKDETPEDALARELQEEASCAVQSASLIGYLRITNMKENDSNRRYPKVSCMLVYTGFGLNFEDRPLKFEATERRLVPFTELGNFHHNWTQQKQQILNYILYRYRGEISGKKSTFIGNEKPKDTLPPGNF